MKPGNLTLRQLRIFIAVADHGSFVAAASSLGLSQPALSQSVRQLEAEVGAPLFVRTTRKVQLTAIGLSLLPQARSLLDQLDVIAHDIGDLVARRRGRVVVACVPSLAWRLMPPALAMITEAYPGITIELRDMRMRQIKEALLSGEADLGLGSTPGTGENLAFVEMARDRFHAVFPRGHALETVPAMTWRELARHPFIMMSHDTAIRDIVDEMIGTGKVDFKVVAELSNLASVNGYIQQGVGVTALPGIALPRDDHPTLAHRLLEKPQIGRTIAAIWREGAGLSPAAATIVRSIAACGAAGTIAGAGTNFDWFDFAVPEP